MADTSTIPRDPGTWTLANAKAAFPAAAPAPKAGEGTAAGYMAGDHYQDSNAWKGAGRESNGTMSESSKGYVRQALVSAPECFDRVLTRVNGSCGYEADVSFEPQAPGDVDEEGRAVANKAQAADAEELQRDFGAHWDRVQLWGGSDIREPTGVRGVVAYGSSHPSGKGYLRIFFNPKSLTESAPDGSRRIPKQADRQSALNHIEVVAPSPDRCTVYTDPDTLQQTGIFLYTDETDGVEWAELWYAVDEGGRRKTAYRKVREGVDAEAPKMFPWGGNLPILKCGVGLLLSPPVLSLQGAIDVCLTSLLSNTIAHGYSARTEMNAEEDGYWSTDRPGTSNGPERVRIVSGTTEYFWREQPVLGNKIIRRLNGFEHTVSIDPESGKEVVGVTTPGVHYHNPSGPDAIVQPLDVYTLTLRESCHQGHIITGLAGGSIAEASGDAYEQRRAKHWADVQGVAEAVGTMLGAYTVSLFTMADYLTGVEEPTFEKTWAVKVKSHPTAGPPSTEGQNTTATLKKEKIISEEEATARVGVQDVQGERDRIRQNRSIREMAEDAKALIDTGADREATYIEVGFSPKQAKAFVRSDGEPYLNQ